LLLPFSLKKKKEAKKKLNDKRCFGWGKFPADRQSVFFCLLFFFQKEK
jgi:hypothetical protein